MTLIIDCHSHYTTAPPAHDAWRDAQKAAFKEGKAPPPYPAITDDEIRETIEQNQLKLIRERGADVTIFSPRASAMAHHVGDQAVSSDWSFHCNNLIYRVTQLFPETFVGVCMLPQSPKSDLQASIGELLAHCHSTTCVARDRIQWLHFGYRIAVIQVVIGECKRPQGVAPTARAIEWALQDLNL